MKDFYNVALADRNFHRPQRVGLLIGPNRFFNLLSFDQIHLGPCLPITRKSLFGWVVFGRNGLARKISLEPQLMPVRLVRL